MSDGSQVTMVGKLDFPDASFRMKWASQNVPSGKKKLCRGWDIFHPGNFQVVLRKNWNDLEKFQKNLQAFYNGPASQDHRNPWLVKDDPRFKLDPTKDHAGLYVAAFIRNEWHRALVVNTYYREPGHQFIFAVVMIDYGDHQKIPIDEIRQIPLLFLTNFPAQAIKCCLDFGGTAKAALNDKDFKWTRAEARAFFKIMQDCKYLVEFVRYEINETCPNPMTWFCKVWLAKYETIGKGFRVISIEEIDVANHLFNDLQMKIGEEQKRNKASGKKKPELQPLLTSSDPWECLQECRIKSLENTDGINVSLDEFDLNLIFPST